MKTDLQKYKDFFDEMGIDYEVENTRSGLIRMSISRKHIFYSYGNSIYIMFDENEKFGEFQAWGD